MEKLVSGNFEAEVYSRETGVRDIIEDKLVNNSDREDSDDAFFIGDIGDLVAKQKKWLTHLPRVEPFYAVKCNPDPVILKVLAALKTGFDCASKAEIQAVLNLGVHPSRIIFANPCKQKSHIRFAAEKGVSMMTLDNEAELYKVKQIFPKPNWCYVMLTDDSSAQCQLGIKFGCHTKHTPFLLDKAKELELNVIGVSFHVGSGCRDARTFGEAIQDAKDTMDRGKRLGFQMNLLDIGGGYPGQASANIPFERFCEVINEALAEHFPPGCGTRIIAEPGRFYVASAFTLAVNVTTKRVVARDLQTFKVPESEDLVSNSVAPDRCEEPAFMYYVNDGVYGSFNCLLYDHATVEPALLKERDDCVPTFSTSIWGPSCDGLDRIMEHCLLPELEVGEWIVFQDMGAYTMCAGSEFNGFKRPICYYVIPETLVPVIQNLFPDDNTYACYTCKESTHLAPYSPTRAIPIARSPSIIDSDDFTLYSCSPPITVGAEF
ncbi:LOW QUALITY PROTEIN: ornithine decarboxylase-like [Amphiura filiformis]|uniref:LOW QUALITY PROTEIN: ornithine decarboxylase-like n=1 Tax=Amphiura filiformis TaxID=82378 RepID=UPI003B223E5D